MTRKPDTRARPPDPLMDLEDVAQHMKMSVRHVRRLVDDGVLIPCEHTGSAKRFLREDVFAAVRPKR